MWPFRRAGSVGLLVTITAFALSVGGTAAVAPGGASCSGVVTNGTRPGQDYASIKMNASTGLAPLDCRALCCNDARCATWVFVPAGLYPNRPPGTFCWLKANPISLKGVTCDNNKPGCVSGVVTRGGGAATYSQDPSWKPVYDGGSSEPSGVSSCAVGASEVYVGQRAASVSPIMVLNHNGTYLRGFGGNGEVKTMHGMKLQKTGPGAPTLWTTDSGGSVVSKWDPATGTRLAVFGARGSGLHPVQFGGVADIAFDPTGAAYISDGDGGINARVLKLDPSHTVVWANGNNGTLPSSVGWASPHSLAYDGASHRVLVADRNNNRLRFLDAASGALLGEWPPSVFAFPDCALPAVWSVRVDQAAALALVGVSNWGSGAQCKPAGQRAAIVALPLPPSGTPIPTPAASTAVPMARGFPHEICVDDVSGELYAAAVDTADLPPGAGLAALSRYAPN